MDRLIIRNAKVITPWRVLERASLLSEGKIILAVEERLDVDIAHPSIIVDAEGLMVAPGYIDLHVHGGAGYDTMDATPTAIHGMARFFARHGVTSYLPTTVAASPFSILAAIENVATCPQPQDGAQHLGIHIESPYLNPDQKGAQPLEYLRLPDPEEYEAWFAAGCVRLITLAPEIEGVLPLIKQGLAAGVEFAAGHTAASYQQLEKVVDLGLRQASHTFNGMAPLHHREPGAIGAVLTDERVYAQIIADGVHIHPSVIKLLIRVKGVSRTILITDAIRAAGLPDGEYKLGDQPVLVIDGVPRTMQGGLAGSSLTMDRAVQNVVNFAGVSVPEAIKMATIVPAEAMGLRGRKGELVPGADADMVLLNSCLEVQMTIVGGRIVYRDPSMEYRVSYIGS